MNPIWFVRIPFAITFAGHGAGKLLMPAASAEMLGLPVALSLLVGVAEVLAGVGAIVGGIERAPHRVLVDRLTGLAAAPVLLGAIFMVHWPRWSFVATESHPMGGMEFQVVLLGMALWFLLGGGQRVGGGAVAVDGLAGEAGHGLVLQQPVHHGVFYRGGDDQYQQAVLHIRLLAWPRRNGGRAGAAGTGSVGSRTPDRR